MLFFCYNNIKYIQFKSSIIELFGDPLDHLNNLKDFVPFVIPDSLPQSMIVNKFKQEIKEIDKENQYKVFIETVQLFYQKYIQNNKAKYEINISYKTRKKFEVIFDQNSSSNHKKRKYYLRDIYKHIINRNDDEYKELDERIMILYDDIDDKMKKTITILLPLLHESVQQTQNLMIDAFFRFRQGKQAADLYRAMSNVE